MERVKVTKQNGESLIIASSFFDFSNRWNAAINAKVENIMCTEIIGDKVRYISLRVDEIKDGLQLK